MEDIIEFIVKGVARGLLSMSRILLLLIWEGIGEKLLWYIGWPVAKAITFGSFPKQLITEIEKENRFTQVIVIVIGLVIPFISAFYLVQFLSNGTTGT